MATRLSLKGLGAAALAVEILWGSWEQDYARSIGTSRNSRSSRKISTSNILLFRVAQKEPQMTGVGPKRSSSTGMAFLSPYFRLKKLPCLNTFFVKFLSRDSQHVSIYSYNTFFLSFRRTGLAMANCPKFPTFFSYTLFFFTHPTFFIPTFFHTPHFFFLCPQPLPSKAKDGPWLY